MASFHLEGTAFAWFQEMEKSRIITSRETFVKAFHTRFGTLSYDNPVEVLINLKQTSTIEYYKMHIEVISNKVQGLLDEHRLGCFFVRPRGGNSIKDLNVKPLKYMVAYGLARMQKEHLLVLRQS
jgi:hypothetical protein